MGLSMRAILPAMDNKFHLTFLPFCGMIKNDIAIFIAYGR